MKTVVAVRNVWAATDWLAVATEQLAIWHLNSTGAEMILNELFPAYKVYAYTCISDVPLLCDYIGSGKAQISKAHNRLLHTTNTNLHSTSCRLFTV